ncbi:uncharacterized protein SAPINGB_P002421 [Magnusiomyces paraingens]|uniref:tRNA-5-taurinomethyluridine 2-sulfurtransferase n=1 Tax=Magnusiomyces paraingens TaxID=2606893 RepID=A0A5E8BDT8_9ASCO|nr:uncharacterized protein SAPINGB_P002421 [Saprochaete ingens]VVT49743.1 unnamed protein product [Saprochaete ingens]
MNRQNIVPTLLKNTRLPLARPSRILLFKSQWCMCRPRFISINTHTDNSPLPEQINNTRNTKKQSNNTPIDVLSETLLKDPLSLLLLPSTDSDIYEDRLPGPNDDVWVGLSSGVDSSTSVALLKELSERQKQASSVPGSGKVRGIFMANWSSTAKCAEADWADVQRVCKTVGVECERVSFEREYWQEVFEPMVDMYRQGMTPNPDVGCNRHIKFGVLIKYLKAKYKNNNSKKWWLATGHYARIATHKPSGETHLLRPNHLPKDQSYYLSSISADVFPHILFPLSHYTKPQVRQLAKSVFHLPTAEKPDSQGLCFVSQEHNTFRHFLDEYLPPAPGDFVIKGLADDGTEIKTVVGKHKGIWHATVGQKSGFALPQGRPETKGVWYVQAKTPESREITLVRGNNHPSLFSSLVNVNHFDFLGGSPPKDLTNLHVQYRSLQAPEPVKSLECKQQGSSNDYSLAVEFESPRRAIAPGQYLVLYSGDRVLGSGIITSTTPIANPYS